MTKTKNYFMKPVGFLIILGALVSLLAAPATAQTPPDFPLPVPVPTTTEPVYDVFPVDKMNLPPSGPPTEDPSDTLAPSGVATPPPTPPAGRGPIALDLSTQARITNLAANVSTRMDLLAERFEQISDRLEARIAIEKAAGRDTSAAEAALGDVAATLINVKIQLSSIDTEVQAMVTSSDSYTAWGELKISYFDISSQFLRVHRSLTVSVENLR